MKLKIKPTKNTIALRKVKFRKESDFNKFLKIVSKNTKELERIKLPSKSDVKKKSGFNLLPILALGALIAALAALAKNKKKGGNADADADGLATANVDIDGVEKLPLPTTAKFPKITKTPKLPGSSTTKTPKLPAGSSTTAITTTSTLPSTAIHGHLTGFPEDVRRYLTGSKTPKLPKTPKTPKLPSNATSRLRTVSDLEYRRLQIKNKIKPALNAAKVVTAATKSPQALAGALIVNDIMNNPVADGTMDAHLAYENELQKEKFKTEANKQKESINKEIDQLIYTRSQLDVNDWKTYQHLTAKIEGLLVKSSAITPKALEQQYIKKSSENPVILYPIDSQNAQPIINAPASSQQSQSQSQAGNDVVGGQSDSLNISELFLLNKLSH